MKIWHNSCISLTLLGKGLKPFNNSNYNCLTITDLLPIRRGMRNAIRQPKGSRLPKWVLFSTPGNSLSSPPSLCQYLCFSDHSVGCLNSLKPLKLNPNCSLHISKACLWKDLTRKREGVRGEKRKEEKSLISFVEEVY